MADKRKEQNISMLIKEEARKLGFSACGIAKAEPLTDKHEALETYLKMGYHGEMKYLENHFEKRLDPTLLHEGTKSVIMVSYSYYSLEKQADENAPIISKYTYGKDYHLVIKDKLNKLLDFIKKQCGEVNARIFVDSAPVFEKAWAQKAGLGWIGKNSLVVNKVYGSMAFLGDILIDVELEYDQPCEENYCGRCTRCMDACPTKAITSPGVVNGSRCISYLTVELKGEIPDEFKGMMKNRAFACDICQDVCPFNRKSKINYRINYKPSKELLQLKESEWHSMDESRFLNLFNDTAMMRINFDQFKRNLNFLRDH